MNDKMCSVKVFLFTYIYSFSMRHFASFNLSIIIPVNVCSLFFIFTSLIFLSFVFSYVSANLHYKSTHYLSFGFLFSVLRRNEIVVPFECAISDI